MADEMLELDAPRERRKLRVAGKEYEVLNIDEAPFAVSLGLQDLQGDLQKVADIADGKSLPLEDIAAMTARLRKAVAYIVPGLDPAGLSDPQCMRVFTYFLGASAAAAPDPTPAPAAAGVPS